MRAAIALGSNLPSPCGDPAANLREALARLSGFGQVTAVSSFHQTDPVGYAEQPRFTNAAALLSTDLGPLPLLRALLAVEQDMGRLRSDDTPPKGPRIIDLDLLLYEDPSGRSLVLNDPQLVLPHPEMRVRRFVLEPLAEIGGSLQVPPTNTSVQALLRQLSSTAAA